MAFTKEFQDGTSPGISAALLNEPFHITDATAYDGTNDDLNIVVGPGRADFGEGAFVEKLSDTTVTVAGPAASTTYYVFLQRAGTFRTSTSSARNGDAKLGSVTTASDKTVASRDDLRGILVPSAETLDHGQLQGKGDDDHTQYVLTSGARSMDTLVVTGATTVNGNMTVKGLVDQERDIPRHGFYDTGEPSGNYGRRYWFYHNGGRFHILVDRDDDGTWETPHPVQVNKDDTIDVFGYKALTSGNATAEDSGVLTDVTKDGTENAISGSELHTVSGTITIPSHWNSYNVRLETTFRWEINSGGTNPAGIEAGYLRYNGSNIHVGGSTEPFWMKESRDPDTYSRPWHQRTATWTAWSTGATPTGNVSYEVEIDPWNAIIVENFVLACTAYRTS